MLTHTEFDLLAFLATNAGKVLSREKILNHVWGYEYPIETRVIDVHIRNLRRKIEQDPVAPVLHPRGARDRLPLHERPPGLVRSDTKAPHFRHQVHVGAPRGVQTRRHGLPTHPYPGPGHQLAQQVPVAARPPGRRGHDHRFELPDRSKPDLSPEFPGQGTWTQVTTWAASHAALLLAIGAGLALVGVALFLLSAVANGALVRGSAEHDAERPFGLRQAWRAGVETFWPVLGIKFFAVIVYVTLGIVIGGLGLLTVAFVAGGAIVAAVATGLLGGLLLLAGIPFVVVFGVAIVLAVRAAVLDGKGPSDSFRTAFEMMWRRRGRVALFWLVVSIAGALAAIGAGLALVVAAVPIVALTAAAYVAAGWPLAVAMALGLGSAWLIVVLTFVGGVKAFTSTCWTVAYTPLRPGAAARRREPAAAGLNPGTIPRHWRQTRGTRAAIPRRWRQTRGIRGIPRCWRQTRGTRLLPRCPKRPPRWIATANAWEPRPRFPAAGANAWSPGRDPPRLAPNAWNPGRDSPYTLAPNAWNRGLGEAADMARSGSSH